MIKRNITLEEAERRFPSSTIEWEVVGGNERTESYQNAARLGAPLVRWNVLRDVLCLGWFDRHGRTATIDFYEIAFWTVDLHGYKLVGETEMYSQSRFISARSQRPDRARDAGQWVFNDPARVWALNRNWTHNRITFTGPVTVTE